ncbi:DUF3332 domain-containing protein [Archangium violaceum]|uniref:DUF3332 domain-containing protein n=1 Tax=Archangium violaceum TaxID=83451 RepID=UPI001950E4BA|nr:DUF3332 domain-containing protein [Archangium violaceum]QRO00312.1 DUF3332 domain-containing protein [Archangium violaceum]
MKSRPSRLFAALFATVLSLHVSGCFGSFALTRKIYGLNESVSDNKFVRWLVFLGFSIIPVYAVGTFVDAIVFNSLEFWTGSNPLASAEPQEDGSRIVRLSPTDTLRLSRDEQSGVMRVALEREGQEPVVRYFEPLDNGMAVRDEAGALLVRAYERADGAVEVVDASGSAVTVHSREAVAQAREAFFQEGVAGLASQVTSRASMEQGLALACPAH